MFAAKLRTDPVSTTAKTLDQAVMKLDALMKMGNADTKWGFNISNAAKDLEEKYHHDFIRFLANPGGYKGNNEVAKELETMNAKSIPAEGQAAIPEDLLQTYSFTQNGDDFDVMVTNADEDDEKVARPDVDDEKCPPNSDIESVGN